MAKNPYGYPEFISSTGYGTGVGLKGWNCYHDFHPFIPGVDEPNYTEEEVAQMNAEENVPRKFGDKEYTAYEATQRQRELERVMRKYGEESHLLELGGANEDTLLATKVRYRTASQEYAAFSKAMGLPQQRERIRNGMESLAQYAQTAPKTLDFSGESGIMSLRDEVDDDTFFFPITESSIQAVPKISAFDSDELNEEVKKQCKNLLSSLIDDEVGTEGTVSIRLRDLTSKMVKGASGEGGVKPIRFDEPYISIHNHPSNSTFSAKDLRELCLVEECQSIIVIGNDGISVYIMSKEKSFNYFELLAYIADKIDGITIFDSQGDFLKGAERYGVNYYERID